MTAVQDLDDRLRRLEELRERTTEEIDRLRGRRQRAVQLLEQARREAHLAEMTRKAPARYVRAWARTQGIQVGDRGRIPLKLREKYLQAVSGSVVRTEATAPVRHPDQGRDSDHGADHRTPDPSGADA